MLLSIDASSALAARVVAFSRAAIFRRHFVARRIEHECFDTVRRPSFACVAVNRDEEIGGKRVGSSGPLLERYEAVVVPRQEHRKALRLKDLRRPLPDVERDVLFDGPRLPDRARVSAAVSRVEYDARYLAQTAIRERSVACDVDYDSIGLDHVEGPTPRLPVEIEDDARTGAGRLGANARDDARFGRLGRGAAEVHAVQIDECPRSGRAVDHFIAASVRRRAIQRDHDSRRISTGPSVDADDPRGSGRLSRRRRGGCRVGLRGLAPMHRRSKSDQGSKSAIHAGETAGGGESARSWESGKAAARFGQVHVGGRCVVGELARQATSANGSVACTDRSGIARSRTVQGDRPRAVLGISGDAPDAFGETACQGVQVGGSRSGPLTNGPIFDRSSERKRLGPRRQSCREPVRLRARATSPAWDKGGDRRGFRRGPRRPLRLPEVPRGALPSRGLGCFAGAGYRATGGGATCPNLGLTIQPIYADRATGETSPDARSMIDAYLQRFARRAGSQLDPLDSTGYTLVRKGSASVGVNMLEDHGVLLLVAPLMDVPSNGREALYRRLLELSFLATSDSAFAIDAQREEIVVRSLRRLSGLDYEEFEDLLETVGKVADDWDDALVAEFPKG